MGLSEAFADLDYFILSDEEADFGFSEVSRLLRGRTRGLSCLEVGTGPGLLLAKMQAAFPDCTFEGIEPVGSGFSKTEAPLAEVVRRTGIVVHRCGYEQFTPRKEGARTYDLIYSVNVFEHVHDWRHYLTWANALLAPEGRALILCPNYAFPWEAHFRIPSVINKEITHRLFARKIVAYERDHDYAGLWASLNYVTKRQVLRFARAHGLKIASDEGVMQRMFRRLFTDPAFASRQRALAGVAKLFYRLGITKVLQAPGVRLLAPFMALTMTK